MSVDSIPGPLLIGHRGCRHSSFRENTIRAFRHSLASGCAGFEFDVRLTADQKLICVHDAVIGKLQVSDCDYKELLNEYFKKNRNQTSDPIPLLEEVLQEFGRSAFLNIELKVAGLEGEVLELLKRFPSQRVVVSSFLPEVICHLAEKEPELKLGFIFDGIAGLRSWPDLPGPYVIPRYDLISREFVKSVHDANRKVIAWTVNHRHDMRRLAGWGIDGLISDNPALLFSSLMGE